MRTDYTVGKITRKEMKPFSLLVIALIALFLSGCGSAGSTSAKNAAGRLTEDEKHRLYSAALAASESPLDTDTFKDVCQKIGIFDAAGKPNDQYMAFVSQHVNWGTRSEASQFRHEINSRDRAKEYIKQHLPDQ
jgi:hypothetical protein